MGRHRGHDVGRHGLTASGDLGSLAEKVVLLLLFVFISTNTAVLVLRKDKVEHRHFRVPVVVPYLALASCVVLLLQQGADIWLRAAILLAIGEPFCFLSQWIRTRKRTVNASNHQPALAHKDPLEL